MATRAQSPWQGHKHTQSTDSEISYFDSSSSSTEDSWSGYFEGWKGQARDSYCPQIVSCDNSPTRAREPESTEPDLLPTACRHRRRRRQRPTSIRRDAGAESAKRPLSKTKRYGIVPYASPSPGEQAAARLDLLLNNSMSNTEDILAAMYNQDWDVTSLQKWYQQTPQSPSDLALFKIMFSLRYTLDEPSPLG